MTSQGPLFDPGTGSWADRIYGAFAVRILLVLVFAKELGDLFWVILGLSKSAFWGRIFKFFLACFLMQIQVVLCSK